ncbi:MAG: hypothetical protein PHT04_03970 [Eubacteriales bacterium]|nr:hypothetical protein [Eubacteriales bacterium]
MKEKYETGKMMTEGFYGNRESGTDKRFEGEIGYFRKYSKIYAK